MCIDTSTAKRLDIHNRNNRGLIIVSLKTLEQYQIFFSQHFPFLTCAAIS